jgi:hypothetical protein
MGFFFFRQATIIIVVNYVSLSDQQFDIHVYTLNWGRKVVGERGWLQQVRIRIAKVNIKNYTGSDKVKTHMYTATSYFLNDVDHVPELKIKNKMGTSL